MTDLELRPIGVIESVLTDRARAPRQGYEGAPDAWLVLDPAVIEGLDGLAIGASIVIVTWLDRARRDTLRTHPGNDPDRPEQGVFTTRSPDRPNPIGLHEVTVLAIDESRVQVDRMEALDQTPILDIKPVLRAAPAPTAADVVRRHLARVDAGMTGGLADAYHAAAVVELPFMPGGRHRLAGREAIRQHFSAAASMPLRLRVRNLVIYQTTDPDVVVAEYDYHGVVTTTGRTFTVANVQILRIEEQHIVASRDYHDHPAIGSALSGGS